MSFAVYCVFGKQFRPPISIATVEPVVHLDTHSNLPSSLSLVGVNKP